MKKAQVSYFIGYPLTEVRLLFLQGQTQVETSLVVQWLRLCAPNAGGLGLNPGQGTRSLMPQLKKDPAYHNYRPGAVKEIHTINIRKRLDSGYSFLAGMLQK